MLESGVGANPAERAAKHRKTTTAEAADPAAMTIEEKKAYDQQQELITVNKALNSCNTKLTGAITDVVTTV